MQGQVEVPSGRAVSDKICAVARQLPWQVIAGFGNSSSSSSSSMRRVKWWIFLPVSWSACTSTPSHSPNLTAGPRHFNFNSQSQNSHDTVNHISARSHIPSHQPTHGLIGPTQAARCGQLPVRGRVA